MNSRWIPVYSVTDEIKAQIIQQMLASYNIESIVVDKKDSVYVFIGDLEIHVTQDDALRARALIQKYAESGELF